MGSVKAVIPAEDRKMVCFHICFLHVKPFAGMFSPRELGRYVGIPELVAPLLTGLPNTLAHVLLPGREKIGMSGAVEEVIDKHVWGEKGTDDPESSETVGPQPDGRKCA